MKNLSKPSIIIASILLMYVIFIGGYLIYWNQHAGGLIQGWYHEYMGADGQIHGSGKWRIPIFFNRISRDASSRGMDFSSFALFYGSWVYPFSVIAFLLFGKNLSRTNEKGFQKFLISGMLVAVIFLSAFLYLGVWTSVTSH